MADIGTDHGFLPFYLAENGISPKVILADISPGSLMKAKENSKYVSTDAEIDFRLGDGLDVLSPGEVDVIVIAGLGATTMSSMPGQSQKKARSR